MPVPAAPPPPALVVAQPTHPPETRAWVGVGNPEYVHAGVQQRWAHWGAALTVGTLGLTHSVGGSVRYFVPAGLAGSYVEAGTSWLRLTTLSPHTPGELFPLGYWNIGWQGRLSRWVVDVAAGPPPFHLMNSEIVPLSVLNATTLPRVRIGVGYAF